MKNIILSIVVLCTIGAAQQLIVKTNGEIKKIASNTSGISVSSVDNNIITSESQNDNIRLIVELKAPSRAEQKINGRVFSKTTADMTKQQLVLADAETKVNREFENIFSGFAVTTKRQNIQAIASLPGVKSVYPDAVVNAVPYSVGSASQDIPKNPASAATGKQVRIGIIDTGIDYNHEAFGKGFGSGFAVTGGYDFVNNDPDPMDDNGHGTHVAGIIGGNSATITGAAKDAILFAYKVLDQSGSGSSSSVIAAIEQAMRDSIQVLNLSLGTPSGSADDPLTSAVNRAVQSGMIVVVAAGNTGEYSTINSPGTAEFALTVGATDANAIASFSSKGPETENYRIKPDIVAPGVNILSAKKGGGYVQMSGTSMATPYVTAIAAGMRELHPEWSAIQIRDAIVSNSTDIGNSLFSQGHGKVSERVLLSSVFSSPAQLSFGFNPPAEASWKQLRSVTLYNKSSEPRTYRLISSSTNPALQFRFVPQQVEIVPQGSAEIAVELETNNLFLSNNSAFENGYSGKLLAVGTSDTISVPYAFFKGPMLQLHFNEVPWLVMIHNRSNFSKTLSPKVNSVSLIVKEGTYDIVTSFYGSRYVVTDEISVTGKSTVDVTSTDAAFPVSFKPINEKGEQLNLAVINGTYSYLEAFVYQPTGFAIVGMGGGKTTAYSNSTKYFSKVNKNYSYGYSMTLLPNNRTSYTFDVIVDSGITAARPIVFQAADIKHIDVKYNLDATIRRAFPITWTTYIGKFSSLGVTFYDGNSDPLTFPFLQDSYYTQRIKQFPIFHQREAYSY